MAIPLPSGAPGLSFASNKRHLACLAPLLCLWLLAGTASAATDPLVVPVGEPNVFDFPLVRLHFKLMHPQTKEPWSQPLRKQDLAIIERVAGIAAQPIEVLSLQQISKKRIKRKKRLNLLLLLDTSCSMGYRKPRRPHLFKGVDCGRNRARLRSRRMLRCHSVGHDKSSLPSRFDRARAAAQSLIQYLYRRQKDIRIGLQFFDTRSVHVEPILFYTRAQEAQLLARLAQKQPISWTDTPLHFALRQAVQAMRARPAALTEDNAIMLLTDGVDDTQKDAAQRVTQEAVLQELRPIQGRANIRICAVKLDMWGSHGRRARMLNQRAARFMQQLATITQGILVPAGNFAQIKALFGGILFEGTYMLVGKSRRFRNNPGRILQGDLSYGVRYGVRTCTNQQACKAGQVCHRGLCQIACSEKRKCGPGERCQVGLCRPKPPIPPYMRVSTASFGQLGVLMLGGCGVLLFLWLIGFIRIGGGGGGSGGAGGSGGGQSPPPPQEDPNPHGKTRSRFVVGNE